jgi:hypothetical protein
MKKVIYYCLSLILVTQIFSSCGRWSDIIKLSTKSAEFSSLGDSIIITTKGDWWWLSGIVVDNMNYHDFDGINILADTYTAKRDCFVFEKRDKNTLFIKLEPNPLNTKRIVVFELEAGDYFDKITITQNPK